MSGTTIRDVLVKISLQTDTKGFKVPDFADIEKQLQKIQELLNKGFAGNAKTAEGYKKQGEAAEQSGKKAEVAASKAIEKERQKAQAIRATTEAYLAEQAAAKRAQQEILAEGSGGYISPGQRSQELREAANRDRDIAMRAMDAEKQRAEVLGQLATGAMQAARGVAFLTAANDEDYQSMLRTIAKYQGYFDALAGGLTIYKALIEAKKIATAATRAETVAESALGSAVARTKLLQGAGAIARFAGPIGAGLAVGYGLGKAGAYAVDQFSGTAAMRSRDQRQAEYFSDGAIAERQQAGMQAMSRRFEGNRDQLGLSLEIARSRFDRGGTSYDQRMAFYDRQVQEQEGKMLFAQQAGGSETQQVQAAREVLEYQKSIVQIERERLQQQQSRESMLRSELQITQQILDKANAAARSAQERFDSEEARFGRLEKFEQDRLIELGKKVRGGTADDAEIRELDQSGFGRDLTESIFKGKGKAAGFELFASTVGDDKELQQSQRDLRAAQASAGEAQKEAAEQQIEAWRSMEKTQEKIFEAMQKQVNANAEMQRRIEDLEREAATRRNERAIDRRFRNG
jgi:hypothetical protein